ncbi:MAG: hypothetical protein GX456_04525 [Verrucomicrobia bacterium]|nr:hypothetical protein [Verrucomicrobiota bacterium]
MVSIARAPARGGKSNGVRSAAVPGRINTTTDNAPVSFTQTRRPKVYLLGAGKNARAPARGGKSNGVRSAAVPGRINPMTDRTTGFDHANLVSERSPAGCGEESPRSRNALEKPNGVGSAAVPGRINPMADRTTGFDHANRTTEHSPAGGGQECPRSCRALKTATTSGARQSSCFGC